MMTAMGQAWDKINLFLNIHVFLAFLSVMIYKNNCLFSAIVHKTSVLGFSTWKGKTTIDWKYHESQNIHI